jgi:hypothetical protein
MAKDGNADGPDLAQPGAIGKEWQTVATHFTEIAPDRPSTCQELASSRSLHVRTLQRFCPPRKLASRKATERQGHCLGIDDTALSKIDARERGLKLVRSSAKL